MRASRNAMLFGYCVACAVGFALVGGNFYFALEQHGWVRAMFLVNTYKCVVDLQVFYNRGPLRKDLE